MQKARTNLKRDSYITTKNYVPFDLGPEVVVDIKQEH